MIETYLLHNLLYGSIVSLALTFNGVAKGHQGAEIDVFNFTALKHLLSCMYNTYTLELCERTPLYIQ